jgi:hypothetical protein
MSGVSQWACRQCLMILLKANRQINPALSMSTGHGAAKSGYGKQVGGPEAPDEG